MKTLKVGDRVKAYGVCESMNRCIYYQANGYYIFRVTGVLKDGFVEISRENDRYSAHVKQLRRLRKKSGAV